MRKVLLPTAIVAVACVVTVLAQPREPSRDSARDAAPEPTTAQRRPPPGEAGAFPPGMEIGSRLEVFLLRPGRVAIRDTWRVGRVECRPWQDGAPGAQGVLRINAVVAHVPDRPDDHAAGLELVLQDEFQDRTFLFDDNQLGDLIVALETVRTTAETMRDPPQDVGRRAVYNLNGLEIGMAPGRAGGYLAPLGPDEGSVGLSPDNFQDMRRLLLEAQTILKREAGRQ